VASALFATEWLLILAVSFRARSTAQKYILVASATVELYDDSTVADATKIVYNMAYAVRGPSFISPLATKPDIIYAFSTPIS